MKARKSVNARITWRWKQVEENICQVFWIKRFWSGFLRLRNRPHDAGAHSQSCGCTRARRGPATTARRTWGRCWSPLCWSGCTGTLWERRSWTCEDRGKLDARGGTPATFCTHSCCEVKLVYLNTGWGANTDTYICPSPAKLCHGILGILVRITTLHCFLFPFYWI